MINRAMKVGPKGLELIKQFEGLKLETYLDAVGIPTIGYGHTGKDVTPGRVISAEDAENLLIRDCATAEKGISDCIKTSLNQNQFDALVSFTYNLGTGRLKSSTLALKLNAGDYAGAAEEFLRWDKAGGKVLAGLTKRRKAERELFLS